MNALFIRRLALMIILLITLGGCSANPGLAKGSGATNVRGEVAANVPVATAESPSASVTNGNTANSIPGTAITSKVQESNPGSRPEPQREQITETHAHAAVAPTLDVLVRFSTIIVIGTVSESLPNNVSLLSDPKANYSSIVNLREVGVERYLKGRGEKTLTIAESTGYAQNVNGKQISGSFEVSEWVPRGRYVFFLERPRDYPDLWTGPIEPNKFILTGGIAKPESWAGPLTERFPPTPVDEFLAKVEASVAATR